LEVRLRVLLWVQYKGTGFEGFQKQPEKRTVAGELEKALFKLFQCEIKVLGVSRTDTGAHAVCHPVTFDIPVRFPIKKLPAAVNSFLPSDLKAIEARALAEDFVPLREVLARTYVYLILKDRRSAIFFENLAFLPKKELTLEAITAFKNAVRTFQGLHDFAAFSKTGGSTKKTERIIYQAEVYENKTLLAAVFTGNGFLYGQIRNMIGTSLGVAFSKIGLSELEAALKTGKRNFSIQAVPAHGLYLYRVWFRNQELNFEPEFPFFDINYVVPEIYYANEG
jgi:tRNA pseudouridine38-40 synthase